MRLGLIARADNRGLGQQTWELARHLNPSKVMVVDCPSVKPLPLHLDRFPDAMVVKGFPTDQHCRDFLWDVDVVLSAETFYNTNLPDIAREMGVKTVLQYNHEFLDHLQRPNLPLPDLFAAPSLWRYDEVPYANKVFLPVPIATERFTPNAETEAKRFLHIVGRPAIADRNGTADLLNALEYVTADVVITIRCQEGGYVSGLMPGLTTKDNITLRIDSGDVLNYWDNYDQDVLIMPRRFGGLCLPVNEALGAGMPVIMPSISPNNLWLPSDWLVPATKTGSFMARTRIDIHETDPRELAAKIDQFATDTAFFNAAQKQARDMAEGLSWTALKPMYNKVLGEL